MSRWLFTAILSIAAWGAAVTPALAGTCYEVIDRTDALIFRDSRPPVDMSQAGAASREAMRQRGEQLIIFEIDKCAPLGRLGTPGNKALTVDEIVAEWRNNYGGTASYERWSPTVGVPASSPAQSQPGAPPAAAPRAAPPASNTRSTTSSTPRY